MLVGVVADADVDAVVDAGCVAGGTSSTMKLLLSLSSPASKSVQ